VDQDQGGQRIEGGASWAERVRSYIRQLLPLFVDCDMHKWSLSGSEYEHTGVSRYVHIYFTTASHKDTTLITA